VILLTRLDGSRIGINEDQIERLDETPNSIVTLVNGNCYIVTETLEEIADRIAEFKARSAAAVERTIRPRSRGAARRAAHLHLADATPTEAGPADSPGE
jgi:flagellar protein FlbD